MEISYPLLAAISLVIVLHMLNDRVASPVMAIVLRWMRWIVGSLVVAKAALEGELIDRPFWVVALAAFLLWFLFVTFYNWLAIRALSESPLPLFPHFVANQSGEEWPTLPRLLRVRDWLRAHGFKQVQALKAEVGGNLYLRTSVYQDADALIRLQITFLPQANGMLTVCYSLASQTVGGLRYVTDNLYLPFGGFYPESWLVERNPLRRSLARLVSRHRARVGRAGEAVLPWQTDPLSDLNAQQYELEQVNTELGFLFPRGQRDEHGKITYEGRYRVWKEILLLNYFGRSARYE
ncbi:MAG TPA: hypothetical protein VK717_13250 [Opitutaceae bacterium]|jgi:hypothetical protein|nr:hypothetical protein [Opitutaceae bacterium]